MAQLRRDYGEFVARDAEVVAVGPEDRATFRQFWEGESMPFVGLADPEHVVADLYRQEVNPLKLGRMPALLVIDKAGKVRYQHYGGMMNDIARNRDVLALLDRLNDEEAAGESDQPAASQED